MIELCFELSTRNNEHLLMSCDLDASRLGLARVPLQLGPPEPDFCAKHSNPHRLFTGTTTTPPPLSTASSHTRAPFYLFDSNKHRTISQHARDCTLSAAPPELRVFCARLLIYCPAFREAAGIWLKNIMANVFRDIGSPSDRPMRKLSSDSYYVLSD